MGKRISPRGKIQALVNVGVHFHCYNPQNGLLLATWVLIMVKFKKLINLYLTRTVISKMDKKTIHYYYFFIICTPKCLYYQLQSMPFSLLHNNMNILIHKHTHVHIYIHIHFSKNIAASIHVENCNVYVYIHMLVSFV